MVDEALDRRDFHGPRRIAGIQLFQITGDTGFDFVMLHRCFTSVKPLEQVQFSPYSVEFSKGTETLFCPAEEDFALLRKLEAILLPAEEKKIIFLLQLLYSDTQSRLGRIKSLGNGFGNSFFNHDFSWLYLIEDHKGRLNSIKIVYMGYKKIIIYFNDSLPIEWGV